MTELASYQRAAAIWESRAVSPTERLILLALNEFVDKAGRCFPGQARLAEMTGMSDRTIRRSLTALAAAGIIKISARYRPSGGQTSNKYQIIFEALGGDPPGNAVRPPSSPCPPTPGHSDRPPQDTVTYDLIQKEPIQKEHAHLTTSEESAACVCVELENDQQRQEATGSPEKHQPELIGAAPSWGDPPPVAAAEVDSFVEIYNSARPQNWAAAIAHPGRLRQLRQLAGSVGGFEQACSLLKLAIAHLHMTGEFYTRPAKNGQLLANRNIDHLLRTPKLGGVPYLITYAEAATSAKLDPDAILDAVAAGIDIQAAERQHAASASPILRRAAEQAAEREQQAAERDREFAAARAALDQQRRARHAATA